MDKKEKQALEDLIDRKERVFKIGGVIFLVSLMMAWYLPIGFWIIPVIISLVLVAYSWDRKKLERILHDEE